MTEPIGIKDAMAKAVLQEVFAKPHEYPATSKEIGLRPKPTGTWPDPDISDYEEFLRNDKALAKAESDGLRVVYPAADELQIDIDNEHSYQFYLEQREVVERFIGITATEDRPSKSGLPRRHITIKLRQTVTPLERICLQACFGSDRKRELFGYARYSRNKMMRHISPWHKRLWNWVARKPETNPPTLFFEKKEA